MPKVAMSEATSSMLGRRSSWLAATAATRVVAFDPVRGAWLSRAQAHDGTAAVPDLDGELVFAPVLTDFIELSVGGTLSVGGIGGATQHYRLQIDNVLELEGAQRAVARALRRHLHPECARRAAPGRHRRWAHPVLPLPALAADTAARGHARR